jgi:hypothetical protein
MMKARRSPKAKPCTWKEDQDGNYDTSCGESFILYAGTPTENKINFCCYCGKELKEKIYQEEVEP